MTKTHTRQLQQDKYNKKTTTRQPQHKTTKTQDNHNNKTTTTQENHNTRKLQHKTTTTYAPHLTDCVSTDSIKDGTFCCAYVLLMSQTRGCCHVKNKSFLE